VLLDVPTRIRPDRDFRKRAEAICGPDCIERLAG
jgi:hypothetical protein